MVNDNWYLVLELEFDPPITDPAVIEQKINDKNKFWSSKAPIDSKNAAAYRRYIDCVPQIKKDMSDKDTRNRLANEALVKRDKEIDTFLQAAHRREYYSSAIESIAAKKGWPWSQAALEKGCARNNIKVIPVVVNYEEIFKQHCILPAGAELYERDMPNLDALSFKDLYEFLSSGGLSIKHSSSYEIWREAAIERTKKYNKNTGNSSAGIKLCTSAKNIFKDAASKAKYDRILAYIERTEILEEAEGIFNATGEALSEDAVEAFVDKLVRLHEGNRGTAKLVFKAYCKKNNIQIPPDNGAEPGDYRYCPFCEANNYLSKGPKCKNCGQDLDVTCPECSKTSPSSTKACPGCGFKFEKIKQAIDNCEYAEQCIAALEFSAAERYLADAERLWPGNDTSAQVRSQLKFAKDAIGPLAGSLKEALNEKRYCKAKALYDEICKSYKKYKDADIESTIDGAVGRAKAIIDKAKSSGGADALVEGASQAVEQCADYPEAKQILIDNPPEPPNNISVDDKPLTRTTSVTWDKSPSKGTIYYVVVRKTGAVPNSTHDGEPLGKVSGVSFEDKSANPGTAYYYAVFAERGGVYSKGLVSTSAVTNLHEIADAEAEPGNKFVKLKWSPIPQAAVVKIYRSAGGAEEYIQSTISLAYTDSPLTNGTTYRYRIVLEYSIDGKKQESKGVPLVVEPIKFPEPIAKLRIKQEGEGIFLAEWGNEEDAELYYSEQEPPFKYGSTIGAKKLLEHMHPLEITKRGEGWAQFSHEGEQIIYVTAIVKASAQAIFGKTVRVRKGKSVVIERVSLASEKLCIRINEYEGATQYMVLYKHDKFVEDTEDHEANCQYFTTKQLDESGCLEISPVVQKDYYLTVYAIIKDNGQTDLSIGKEYLFRNGAKTTVNYSFSKKMFSNKEVVIKFSSKEKKFVLPSIEIMYSIGALPMHKSSSKLLKVVEGSDVDGTYSATLDFQGKIPQNVYVKPFLTNDSQNSQYEFKPTQGTNKIS